MKASRQEVKFSLLVLAPSVALIAVFIYAFIANTFYVSMTDWGRGSGGLHENPVMNFVGLENFAELFSGVFWSKFRQDLVNAVFYWGFILVGTLAFGLLIAVMLDKYPKGEGAFRTLFLYPMTLSFIVTGTVWNWLLQPEGGINILPTFLGLPKLELQWLNDYRLVLRFNWQNIPLFLAVIASCVFFYLFLRARRRGGRAGRLRYGVMLVVALSYVTIGHSIAPKILPYEETHGLSLGILGIVIAAVWQYSGYTMAIYLAGLRGISQDLYEAAKIDGASDLTYYLKVALPNLKPITLSAVVILSHISLKLFALIFAMSKPDNPATGHPSVDMYLTTFRGNNFSMGAAMAVLLFLLASLFIIPYVVYTARQKR